MVNERQQNAEILLASTSPFRQKQLEELQIPFRAAAPLFNEDEYKKHQTSPQDLVKELARGKAESLRESFPQAWILGSDQLVHFQGQIIGKAETPEKATQQLLQLAGQSHQLLTAMCWLTPYGALEHTDITEIHMRKISEESASNYVLTNQTWHCAGSYKIECQAALVMEKVITQDPTSVLGLPTMTFMTWYEDYFCE